MRGLRRALPLLVTLLACAWSLRAWAGPPIELPVCGGHVTDNDKLLPPQTRKDVDAKLDKLAHETLIDGASWVVEGEAGPELETLGRMAYGQWKLGTAWDSGVLVIVPTIGRASVVQDVSNPLFTPTEVTLLTALDDPSKPIHTRLIAMTDAMVTLVHAKVDLLGPAHRVRYVFGTLAFLLAGIFFSISVRRSEELRTATGAAVDDDRAAPPATKRSVAPDPPAPRVEPAEPAEPAAPPPPPPPPPEKQPTDPPPATPVADERLPGA